MLDKVSVKSIAHITGGGFFENIPRALPDGIAAQIDKSSVKTPPIFDIIAKRGGIDGREMFNTFNMGVGMTVIVDEKDADTALDVLKSAGEDAYILGKTVKGDCGVILN